MSGTAATYSVPPPSAVQLPPGDSCAAIRAERVAKAASSSSSSPAPGPAVPIAIVTADDNVPSAATMAHHSVPLQRPADEPVFAFEAMAPSRPLTSWWVHIWRTLVGDCITPKYTATVVVRTLWRRRIEVALRMGFCMLISSAIAFYPPIRDNYVSVPYMVPTIACSMSFHSISLDHYRTTS
jgi:hypothetical protein